MKIYCYKTLLMNFSVVAVLFFLLGADFSNGNDLEMPQICKNINKFTFDYLKEFVDNEKAQSNFIISPQSLYRCMAMSYIASGKDTRKGLAKVFYFPADNKELINGFKKLPKSYSKENFELNIANSLWMDDTYADFRKEYVTQVREVFSAAVEKIKFSDKEKAAATINRWVSDNTNGRIDSIVLPECFESRSGFGFINEPAIVLVNTIYFKADWGSKFDKDSTKKRIFHINESKDIKAMLMHQQSVLNYSENDKFKLLGIPYIGNDFSMYVALPKKIISAKECARLFTNEMFLKLRSEMFPHMVDTLLPKFTMSSTTNPDAILSEMGSKDAFDSGKANFDKMIYKKIEAYRIYISQILQEAWIEVHEEGTEAAVATTSVHFSVGCAVSDVPFPYAEFHADHPFLFMIADNKHGDILFIGWISNPEGLQK